MSHNSLYDEVELYDLAIPGPWKGEVEFYIRAARQWGQQVLELACGTGRVTIPLAQAGLTMTGLDLSGQMLARGRSKAAGAQVEVAFIEGDMCDFHLGQQFDLIFIPINSICHLTRRAEIENCLRCVRAHLKPGGRFIVDVFNPSLAILGREAGRWYEVGAYERPDGQWVKLTEQNRYDRATQINHIQWRFEVEGAERVEVELAMRQYFPQELNALLEYNGFVVEAKYGKYGETAFHAESNQQLVVARPV